MQPEIKESLIDAFKTKIISQIGDSITPLSCELDFQSSEKDIKANISILKDGKKLNYTDVVSGKEKFVLRNLLIRQFEKEIKKKCKEQSLEFISVEWIIMQILFEEKDIKIYSSSKTNNQNFIFNI